MDGPLTARSLRIWFLGGKSADTTYYYVIPPPVPEYRILMVKEDSR